MHLKTHIIYHLRTVNVPKSRADIDTVAPAMYEVLSSVLPLGLGALFRKFRAHRWPCGDPFLPP
jgi:hypothetical protein